MNIINLFKITIRGFLLIIFSNLTLACEPLSEPNTEVSRSVTELATTSNSPSEILDQEYAISNLEIYPGQHANVTLPFPYSGRPLGIHDDEIRVLTETTYAVLSDSSREIAFVGTLRPCVLVALRDEHEGRSIVIHKHVDNSMVDIVELIKSHICPSNLSSISGMLFTATPPSYNPIKFQGRTHKEELDHIKKFLITKLGIIAPEKIKSKIITATTDDNVYGILGGYPFAESCVFVDSHLNISSTCFLHEKLFFAAEKLPKHDLCLTHKEILTHNVHVANNYLTVFNAIANPKRTYSTLRQAKILSELQESIKAGLRTESKSYKDVHLESLLFDMSK